MNRKVFSEVRKAYSDCWSIKNYHNRNLNFKASAPVSVPEAIKFLKSSNPGGYNAFDADILGELPAGAMVTIAREGSVCIYVEGKCDKLRTADEHDYNPSTNQTRMWWD